jgi:hypothetical protein
MVRSLPALLSALLLCFACSSAAAAGFNLSWHDCGSHGTSLETFGCDTNLGYRDLITSVVVPADMPQVVGVEALLYLSVGNGQVLPDWWFLADRECRAGRITFRLEDPADPATCEYVLGVTGDAVGAMAWDSQYLGTPDLARIRFIAATPSPNPISAGVEYTVGRIRLANGNTSVCGGCSMPACIYVASVKVTQQAGVGDVLLTNQESRGHVSWQCPADPGAGGCVFGIGCATSTTNPTWGSIKSLYR